MTPKRPIDVLRDSGKSMTIDGDGDDSAISEMIAIGDALYVVKAHSIHRIRLADQIDPDRTNIAIPDTHQQVLSVGASDLIVARTLLTARTLLKKSFLGSSFDEGKGLELSLKLLQELAAMSEILAALEAAEAQARKLFEAQRQQGRRLRLPTVPDARARCDSFAQKAGHTIDTLEDIAKLFYGDALSSKWVDSLAVLAKKRCGKGSPFSEYVEAVRPFLLFVREMRNMIEHPKPDRQIRVSDFRLLPSGQIALPAAEIIRKGAQPETPAITVLMKTVIDNLTSVSEVLLAHLCNENAQPFAGMAIWVAELPPEQRTNKDQRISYVTRLDDQVVRIG